MFEPYISHQLHSFRRKHVRFTSCLNQTLTSALFEQKHFHRIASQMCIKTIYEYVYHIKIQRKREKLCIVKMQKRLL